MSEIEINETRDKILAGLDLAFRRLVEQKRRDDEELVFAPEGKIVHIKAADIDLSNSAQK